MGGGPRLLAASWLLQASRCAPGQEPPGREPPGRACPGGVEVLGVDRALSLVPAARGRAAIRVDANATVELAAGSRAYLADSCAPGPVHDRAAYSALDLLGKTLRYTVNMSNAGCGCKVGFSLSPLRHNNASYSAGESCNDFFCSADKACGASCEEVVLQEANRYAWHTALHDADDEIGFGMGYGGGGWNWTGPRDFSSRDYAPGGRCIDTKAPFQVSASFPVDELGRLRQVDVALSQGVGRGCHVQMRLKGYERMRQIGEAMAEGLTPVLSYMSGENTQRLDGVGQDGAGPCYEEYPAACSASVAFGDFAILPIQGERVAPPPPKSTPASAVDRCKETRETTPVEEHGALSVRGSRVVDGHGRPVRLRGVSLFWSQWGSKYWNAEVIAWLARDWRVTVVRAAMAVEMGGYLMHPQTQKQLIETVVDACIDAGVYVIIDWHDFEAHKHTEEAKDFFEQVAQKYGRVPNVLFEPWHEPQGDVGWSETIRPYHQELVPVIRQHSDNIIILGNRWWSQRVLETADDPVDGDNLAYTFHFWAASHREKERQMLLDAVHRGVPVFASQWGTSLYTGDGETDLESASAWLSLLEQHHISDVSWAINDKAETSSALVQGANEKGGWEFDQLTLSGRFTYRSLQLQPLGNLSALRNYVPLRGDCTDTVMHCEARVSLGGCAELCEAEEQCAGFGYDADGGWCSLKAAPCALPGAGGGIFFERSPLEASPSASASEEELGVQDATECLNSSAYDGYERVFNKGRGTPEAACGPGEAWCCGRHTVRRADGSPRALAWRLRSKGRGCRNYKQIGMNISGVRLGGVSLCAARCAAQRGCTGFGFQSSDSCGTRGNVEVGLCALWSGTCEEEENSCWDDYEMVISPQASLPGKGTPLLLEVSGGQRLGPEAVVEAQEPDMVDTRVLLREGGPEHAAALVHPRHFQMHAGHTGAEQRWVRIFGGGLTFMTLLAWGSFFRFCADTQHEITLAAAAALASKAHCGGDGDAAPGRHHRAALLPSDLSSC